MSKNSLTDKTEPYYRKFGKPAWYRKQPRFPEGRDPYNDLFRDDKIAEIIDKVGRKYNRDDKALQADLRDLAHDYLTAAQTAPFRTGENRKNYTRDQRKRFLEPQVINPARNLLDALDDKNAHQFFEWPDDKIGPDPNKATLVRELTRLLNRVEGVLEGIVERQGDSTDALTEFKMDFANALRMVFKKHYPALPAHVTEHDRAKQPSSEYFNFLRLCAEEIFRGDLVLALEIIDTVTEPARKK